MLFANFNGRWADPNQILISIFAGINPETFIEMEKKYELPEESNDENIAHEPAPEYGTDYGMETDEELREQPPLTQEDLDNALTGEEFTGLWIEYIQKKFDK